MRMPQYISAFSPIAKPFVLMNARFMSCKADTRVDSENGFPSIRVTFGRAAREVADFDVGFLVRMRTLQWEVDDSAIVGC